MLTFLNGACDCTLRRLVKPQAFHPRREALLGTQGQPGPGRRPPNGVTEPGQCSPLLRKEEATERTRQPARLCESPGQYQGECFRANLPQASRATRMAKPRCQGKTRMEKPRWQNQDGWLTRWRGNWVGNVRGGEEQMVPGEGWRIPQHQGTEDGSGAHPRD